MMRFISARALIAAALICIAPRVGHGQANPVAAKPARPEFVAQVRQRLLATGLTPDQLHERLRTLGYPENLFDNYMPGSAQRPTEPGEDVYNSLAEMGIIDPSEVDVLRSIADDRTPRAVRDSLARSLGGALPTARDTSSLFVRRNVVRADVADSLIRLDSGYNIFGLEVFRSESKFEPLVSGPVDANYRLGPGDQLALILTGDVEATYNLTVQREGFVVIPQVGQVYVANITLGQLEDLLYARLGRVYSGVRRSPSATTRFSVSVTGLRTNQIFVLGDVERPGSYMVSSAGTAITALYAAGGPTANGSLRNVQVKRGGQLVSGLDLYDYLLRGDGSKDVRLETGDIVFVPPRGRRVRVVGEVIRPATYEMRPGETLAQLIESAGGFRSDASHRRVQIERILPPEQRSVEGRDRVTIDITSDQLANGSTLNVPIEGGDVVRVFPVARRVRNTVTVKGNVWAPGQIGIEPGMKVADAIRLAGGPKPDVYLGQVLVDRLRPDSTRIQLRVTLADSLGTVINDVPVLEDDVIQLFSMTNFRPDRYVAVGGAVKKPGRIPYRDGMTLRDVVLLSGGLQEGAYLKEAEIARLPDERGTVTTAKTVRVPLDSSYLFDRKPGEPYLGAPGLQASARSAAEVPLKPYDNVLILQQPNWELQRVVTLAGEVNFPGQYALTSRNERLADLIQRAGGLTSEAYPEGTVFFRKKDNIGRVAIDVPRALKDRRAPDNLLLTDGDRIAVPQRTFVVTVRGAVNAPNVVAYVPGKSIGYYVSQAGGAARNGDTRHAFVTQPSGKRETNGRFSGPTPMPGSLVVVPEKDGSSAFSWMNSLTTFLQTTITLVGTIIAVQALAK